MTQNRGIGLTALAWLGACVMGCGGWVDLERPEGSGAMPADASGASAGSSALAPGGTTSAGGKNGRGGSGGQFDPTDGAGGAPPGATCESGACFVVLESPPPRFVPPGAEGPETLWTGRASIDAGSLEDGVLVGTNVYCFIPKGSLGCPFESREPFIWTERDGMVPLDRLESLAGDSFYPTHVSADGNVVVGSYWATPQRVGFFRWTKNAGAGRLGEPADNDSGALRALSRDGSVVAGTSKALSFPAGYAEFVWTASGGFQALDESMGWPASTDIVFVSQDGDVLIGEGRDVRDVARWTAEGGAEVLGQGPDRPDCTFYFATPDASSVFGSCGDWSTPGTTVGFRWTEAEGMIPLVREDGEHCEMIVTAAGQDGSSAFGRARCGNSTEFDFSRWSPETGVVMLRAESAGTTHALGASEDGSRAFGVLGGPGLDDVFQDQEGVQAFRWDADAGLVELDVPGRDLSRARAADKDLEVVVGYGSMADLTKNAVLWNEQGSVDIATALEQQGVDLGGVELTSADRVASRPGRTLIQGDGSTGAWIAWLPTELKAP